MNSENRDKYLTAGWNTFLTLALGLPTLAFAFMALTTETFSDLTAFIVLVVSSAFY